MEGLAATHDWYHKFGYLDKKILGSKPLVVCKFCTNSRIISEALGTMLNCKWHLERVHENRIDFQCLV
jgi:hypothetical protein